MGTSVQVPTVIYIHKQLDKELVERITRKFRLAVDQGVGVIFLIHSPGGMFTREFEGLVREILDATIPTHAVIQTAASCAATLALACKYREIYEDGFFAFHRGILPNVSSAFLEADGKLSQPILDILKRDQVLSKELHDRANVVIEDSLRGKFMATGMLSLNAQQCLAANVVHRVI